MSYDFFIVFIQKNLYNFQLEKLKDENQRLRIECQILTRQVDLYEDGTG